MLPEEYRWIDAQFEPEGDLRRLFDIARRLHDDGNVEAAATVYDRAYGLDPTATDVAQARAELLEQMAVVEHGLRFRYIPGGVFLMGCDTGDEDERPFHPVWLSPHWMSETPVSWAAYCRLMDWEPPPDGGPRQAESRRGRFEPDAAFLRAANKIRLQYCEDHTTRARDWHTHAAGQRWQVGGRVVSAQEAFGSPPRDEPDAPWQYDTKPMVAVAWHEAEDLAARLTTERVRYALPTEAQWEKAARGGLIGSRYAWGDEQPSHQRCDFDRFLEFSICPMKTFPPNGYGLYAVNGGVWEWTRDWYDREYYRYAPETNPEGPVQGQERVVRGGSWADCAEAVTVTFRMSRSAHPPTERSWGTPLTPTIGFRLCRTVIG